MSLIITNSKMFKNYSSKGKRDRAFPSQVLYKLVNLQNCPNISDYVCGFVILFSVSKLCANIFMHPTCLISDNTRNVHQL